MVHAFILVRTRPGAAASVVDGLAGQEAVTEAHVVAGEYDIVVEADGQAVYDVINGVATGMRDVEGVVDTRTYICLE